MSKLNKSHTVGTASIQEKALKKGYQDERCKECSNYTIVRVRQYPRSSFLKCDTCGAILKAAESE